MKLNVKLGSDFNGTNVLFSPLWPKATFTLGSMGTTKCYPFKKPAITSCYGRTSFS